MSVIENPPRVLLQKDGTEVKLGDKVKSFRNEEAIVVGWEKCGRNRVYVRFVEDGVNGGFFPNVFNLIWNYDYI